MNYLELPHFIEKVSIGELGPGLQIEVYNMGGGRFSNCSIIEALDLVEDLTKIKIKREIIKKPRVGDHIWYISNLSKFKKHYPNWKQKYNTKKIIEELIEYQKK